MITANQIANILDLWHTNASEKLQTLSNRLCAAHSEGQTCCMEDNTFVMFLAAQLDLLRKKDHSEAVIDHATHVARHVFLHGALDELVADWITKTEQRPSTGTVIDLLRWSYTQTLEPR